MGIWNWGKSRNQVEERLVEDHSIHFEQPVLEPPAIEPTVFETSVFANLNSCIVLTDEDFRITYLNNTAQHFFQVLESELQKRAPQFSANNIVGAALSTIFPVSLHKSGLDSRAPDSIVFMLEQRVFDLRFSLLQVASGKPIGFIVECSEKSEELIKGGVFDATDVQKALIDIDISGCILSINSRFTEITGYTQQDILGKPYHWYFAEDFKNTAAPQQFWQDITQGK